MKQLLTYGDCWDGVGWGGGCRQVGRGQSEKWEGAQGIGGSWAWEQVRCCPCMGCRGRGAGAQAAPAGKASRQSLTDAGLPAPLSCVCRKHLPQASLPGLCHHCRMEACPGRGCRCRDQPFNPLPPLPATAPQVLIYQALGFPTPVFGHVSLILAPDKSKLSKRHGATSVGEFREEGYLAEVSGGRQKKREMQRGEGRCRVGRES